jgi:hypothetical protein
MGTREVPNLWSGLVGGVPSTRPSSELSSCHTIFVGITKLQAPKVTFRGPKNEAAPIITLLGPVFKRNWAFLGLTQSATGLIKGGAAERRPSYEEGRSGGVNCCWPVIAFGLPKDLK